MDSGARGPFAFRHRPNLPHPLVGMAFVLNSVIPVNAVGAPTGAMIGASMVKAKLTPAAYPRTNCPSPASDDEGHFCVSTLIRA